MGATIANDESIGFIRAHERSPCHMTNSGSNYHTSALFATKPRLRRAAKNV
jgi:hypothetical protein